MPVIAVDQRQPEKTGTVTLTVSITRDNNKPTLTFNPTAPRVEETDAVNTFAVKAIGNDKDQKVSKEYGNFFFISCEVYVGLSLMGLC
jgi:uncharacterized protein (DUF924 family)